MNLLNEYRASDWKISKLDPDTSGKYIFDYMDYKPHSRCDNCGHRNIAWNCHIHDAEDPEKTFVVGDDCIEFLLAISGGLENPKDLEKFRHGKSELLRLFNKLRQYGIDTSTMDGVIGVVDSLSTPNTIDFYTGNFSSRPVKTVGLIRRVWVNGMTVKDWIHFFPNIKKVLVSCEGSFYKRHSRLETFTSLNSKLHSAIVDIPSRLAPKNVEGWEVDDFDTDEICPELGLGKIKVVRRHGMRYYGYTKHTIVEYTGILLSNGKKYELDAARYGNSINGNLSDITTNVIVFNDSIKPLFPECTIDTDALKSTVEDLNPGELAERYLTDGSGLQKTVETVERRQRDEEARARAEEERKAGEEEERKRTEERRATERKNVLDAFATNPEEIVEGLKGHCITSEWVNKYSEPLTGLFTKKIGEAVAASPGTTSITIDVNNCIANYKLLDRQIATLKSMNGGARVGYLNNIVKKQVRDFGAKPSTWTTTTSVAELTYTFTPTDLKDTTNGTVVIGKTTITIRPVVAESHRKTFRVEQVNEDVKVTLTMEQLRRLVRESTSVRRNEPCDESVQGAVLASLLASLFAVGTVVRADNIKKNVPPNASQEEIQDALNQAESKTYGGFSAAQATNIVMRTIYQEGKGESSRGRRMIATVIWNRAGGDPNKFAEICLKKSQFSVWNALADRSPKGVRVKVPSGVTSNGQKKAVWDECRGLVESMFSGSFQPDGNYNAYLNKNKASSSAVNGWGTTMTGQVKVGNHTFGYLREKDGFRRPSKTTSVISPRYVGVYKVKAGDKGVSFIAKDLISSGKTKYSNVRDLTNEIIRINRFKTDRNGNPIIRPGDLIKLPA